MKKKRVCLLHLFMFESFCIQLAGKPERCEKKDKRAAIEG